MFKLVGVIFILLGSIGMGYGYKKQFDERIWHMMQMKELFQLMLSQVRYQKATLPESCKEIAHKLEKPYAHALEEIDLEMKENLGKSFSYVWENSFKSHIKEAAIGKVERELLLEFGKKTGNYDLHMQENSMEQAIEELDKVLKQAQSEIKEKGKLAIWLGTMGGVFLTIILI